jgi:hypothetical protein
LRGPLGFNGWGRFWFNCENAAFGASWLLFFYNSLRFAVGLEPVDWRNGVGAGTIELGKK